MHWRPTVLFHSISRVARKPFYAGPTGKVEPRNSVIAYVNIGNISDKDHRRSVDHLASGRAYGVPNVKRAFLLMLLVITGPIVGRATSVVFFWTPEQIIIAADSMASRGKGVEPFEICKIWQVGPYFYSLAGLLEDPSIRFSVPSIIQSHWQYTQAAEAPNFFQLAMLLDAEIMVNLNRVRSYRENRPGVLDRGWISPLNYTDQYFLMAGVQKGELVASFWASAVSTSDPNASSITPDLWRHLQCPSAAPTGDVTTDAMNIGMNIPTIMVPTNNFCWGVLGERTAIFNYISTHPQWLQFDMVSLAKHLIAMEKAEAPDSVGFATVVLSISRNGVRWIEKGVCGKNEDRNPLLY